MVLAQEWAIEGNPYCKWLAGKMLDTVWSTPDFYHNDPASPMYGLNNWYERGQVFYGDDNARVILPTLVAGRLLDDDRWDERVLRCILANLRTTGRLGFREWRLDTRSPSHRVGLAILSRSGPGVSCAELPGLSLGVLPLVYRTYRPCRCAGQN